MARSKKDNFNPQIESQDQAQSPEIAGHEVDDAADLQLGQLAIAIATEMQKHTEELQTLVGEEKEEASQRLADQIAEDQALAAELQAQASEAEEVLKNDPELRAALPQNADVEEIESCLEAMLFMLDRPVSIEKLRELLGPDFTLAIFQEAITALQNRYRHPRYGIELVEVAGGYQLRTKSGRSALAKKLAKVQTQKLSSGAMETLAIVAYRQPVMKEDIDKIRGVDSSYFVRGLLDKKLIQIDGRSDLPGRPMVYTTTKDFLELFGLKDLSAMPSLREIEQMIPSSQSSDPADEDPRVRKMREMVGQMTTDTSTTLNYNPREDDQILKEFRERINLIPTSTPYLDEQKQLEKQAEKQVKDAELAAKVQPELTDEAALNAAPTEEPREIPSIELPELGPEVSQ